MIKYTTSTTDQIAHGGYSNTDAATFSTSREGKAKNSRSINHNMVKRNNETVNRDLAIFTGEVLSVGYEKRSMKDQFKTFQDKVKQYVLHEFNNTKDIIIIVQDLKDIYAHVDIDNSSNISK